MSEGSWVGLDVHARSVVAGVIDQGSGEVRSLRLPPGGGRQPTATHFDRCPTSHLLMFRGGSRLVVKWNCPANRKVLDHKGQG
jgi:hypothetical protein